MTMAVMFHIVLVEPEIPPNTGNVIRLAANTGCSLHLIEPLGFSMEDRQMRRAGLDYHEYASVQVHAGWTAFLRDTQPDPTRMFAMTTHGSQPVHSTCFLPGDWLVFGAETRGLPPRVARELPAGPAPAPAHGAGSAQPQFVQRGGSDRVRGLAPEQLCHA